MRVNGSSQGTSQRFPVQRTSQFQRGRFVVGAQTIRVGLSEDPQTLLGFRKGKRLLRFRGWCVEAFAQRVERTQAFHRRVGADSEIDETPDFIHADLPQLFDDHGARLRRADQCLALHIIIKGFVEQVFDILLRDIDRSVLAFQSLLTVVEVRAQIVP